LPVVVDDANAFFDARPLTIDIAPDFIGGGGLAADHIREGIHVNGVNPTTVEDQQPHHRRVLAGSTTGTMHAVDGGMHTLRIG
jgi:hypothetical protein